MMLLGRAAMDNPIVAQDAGLGEDGVDFRIVGLDAGSGGRITLVVKEPGAVSAVGDVLAGPTQEAPAAHVVTGPNPTLGAVHVSFDLMNAAAVGAQLFDLQGRRVRTLPVEQLEAGAQRIDWDGRNEDGTPAAVGITSSGCRWMVARRRPSRSYGWSSRYECPVAPCAQPPMTVKGRVGAADIHIDDFREAEAGGARAGTDTLTLDQVRGASGATPFWPGGRSATMIPLNVRLTAFWPCIGIRSKLIRGQSHVGTHAMFFNGPVFDLAITRTIRSDPSLGCGVSRGLIARAA